MTTHQITINHDHCIGCGLCTKTCVAHNIELQNRKASLKLPTCLMCGQCAAICPQQAIHISGYACNMEENDTPIHLQPQEVLDVIRYRRSIRQFQQTSVPDNVIHQILEAGRLTHTAKNMQDVSFIVLQQNKDQIEELAVRLFRRIKPFVNLVNPIARQNDIHSHFFFFNAPLVILILAKNKTNGLLAAQNMEFVAEANELGVLFSGYFTTAANTSHRIKKELSIPKGKRVAMTLVLGYPSIKFLRAPQREALDATYR